MDKIYAIHGDVSLVRINQLPDGVDTVKYTPNFVLEKGEGVHLHTIKDKCEIYQKGGVMYLKVDSPIRIDHEEHGVEVIEPGIYRKDLEQVFDYEEMEARKVID